MACCNPFDISGHDWSSRKKKLRPVQSWMCEKAPIAMGGKICDSCRKKLAKEPTASMAVPSVLSSSGSEAEEAKQYREEKAMNKCFEDIGETPFSRRKARRKDYSRQKIEKLSKALQDTEIRDDGSEMLQQLKEKFEVTTKKSEKLQSYPKVGHPNKFSRSLVLHFTWPASRRSW